MEKFTVDLDKVLDEFEFNEEQAVRHALQHFKREDLPATKYQKPHFKPINIAEADFAPCKETTMSFSTYEPDYSDEPFSEVAESDSCEPVNQNNKIHHVTPDLSDSTITLNNIDRFDMYKFKSNHCNYTDSVKESKCCSGNATANACVSKKPGLIKEVAAKNEILENVEVQEAIIGEQVVEPEGVEEAENFVVKSSLFDPNEVELKSECSEDQLKESHSSLSNDVECDSSDSSVVLNSNYQVSVDSAVEEVDIEKESEVNVEKSNSELPELTPVSQTSQTSGLKQTVNVASFAIDGIKSNVVVEEGSKGENEKMEEEEQKIKPELITEPAKGNENDSSHAEIQAQTETNGASQKPETDVTQSQSASRQESEVVAAESTNVETIKLDVTEIKPIQFETQLDITDEELQKYLEELEEEELEEKKKEAESKPNRPQSLNLKTTTALEPPGSPGQTPLPKSLDGGDVAGVTEENLRNESIEESNTESGDNMDETEDLERLLEATVASESSEPPLTIGERRLGKVSPFWMPDHLASSCMECDCKFNVIKRRHHCRACGRILCSKCCGMRASLEYLQNQEQRVCETCFRTLAKVLMYELQNEAELESSPRRRPNPNNPMEYCSTVPPPLQMSSSSSQSPPSVMVPVGVLKREGSSKVKETPKQVMFSDGIRPGGDLTELDGSEEPRNAFRKRSSKKVITSPGTTSPAIMLPPIDPASQSFIIEKSLPPIYITNKGETVYEENWPLSKIMEKLKDPNLPPLQFAINRNLLACVKIVKLDCCMKETCWVICSKGMGNVGQDEIIILLTLDGENDDRLPTEILLQFQYIYQEAARGNTVNELGFWCVKESTFLDSKQHGGFLFIRPTFQCLNRIELPPPPYLVGILIHRSEVPWARVFPFRLMLRLGAEFRYYPCPLVSVRFREPVYYEIGHTIINLLADFRNLSYTIPNVRGLRIHMEANQTTILIPRNRYDQVVRALNNSNDPVLALAGSFSPEADAHLVCMQSKGNEVTYSTHAININDKPRKLTGASFVVLNGALKTTSGVAAKSSIVEDGVMVQVPSETMTSLRNKLRNMEDWSVCCGPIEGRNSEEVVQIVWCEDDKNFNVGVKSVIDNMPLDGVPSIRVHSGKDYVGCSKFIRWTQVFIIKCEDGATSAKIGDPLEVNKLSEGIARATCIALIKLLELLAASGLTVLAVRATMDKENVGYEAGSNGEKLAPIYMNSLDNELIPILHKAASINDSVAVLELVFHIMDK